MKKILKVEELAMFLLAIWMFIQTDFAWWVFPLLLLVPDISMAGYAVNSRVGAFCYNLFHHKAVAILVFGIGVLIDNQYFELAGAILFGHSSLDRIFGYGLKFFDSFTHTHLGSIGKK